MGLIRRVFFQEEDELIQSLVRENQQLKRRTAHAERARHDLTLVLAVETGSVPKEHAERVFKSKDEIDFDHFRECMIAWGVRRTKDVTEVIPF